MKVSEIETCSFSKYGFHQLIKSPTIWGHHGKKSEPLCYLRKPKSMSDSDWEEFLQAFDYFVEFFLMRLKLILKGENNERT